MLLEPAVVDRVRDEPAHVRVHPAGGAEEDAELGRNGGVAVEHVLEAGEPGLAGVAALGRLGELHLVADQDQVPGRHARRRPRWRGRPGRPRRRRGSRSGPPAPSRLKTQAVPPTSTAPRRARRDVLRLRAGGRCSLSTSGSSSLARRPCRAAPEPPARPSASTTAPIRLRMTLWLLAVTPIRLPGRSRSTMMAAAVEVLPVPGGPWMQRVVPSSRRARSRDVARAARSSSRPDRAARRCGPGDPRRPRRRRSRSSTACEATSPRSHASRVSRDRLLDRLGADVLVGDEAQPVGQRLARADLELDQAGVLVHAGDLARRDP